LGEFPSPTERTTNSKQARAEAVPKIEVAGQSCLRLLPGEELLLDHFDCHTQKPGIDGETSLSRGSVIDMQIDMIPGFYKLHNPSSFCESFQIAHGKDGLSP
jgi:hypothetical protein